MTTAENDSEMNLEVIFSANTVATDIMIKVQTDSGTIPPLQFKETKKEATFAIEATQIQAK